MIPTLRFSSFAPIAVISSLALACVINADDDDSGSADSAADETGSADSAGSADGTGSADSADSSPADEGGGTAPQDGPWHYDETGQTTNACTFIDEPTNGTGTYVVENTGPGAFVITPGDGTPPFECTLAGSAIECAERLQDTIEVGPGATGSVIVGISGTLESSTLMAGSQQGRIECEGADCATIEATYGVTFPCTFDVPFEGAAD